MGRWMDDDSHLPAGMERIGYDSDTQRYTFRDSDGCIYEGSESGGMLTLVSRPHRKHDDEPLRLMPNSPTRLQTKVKGAPEPWTSPTSPTSFHDFLPPQKIAGAPPPEPPRRNISVKVPSGGLQRAKTAPGQKSLWSVVRSAATPSKSRMRDVVDTVTRRRSSSSKASSDLGHGRDGSYARLSAEAAAPLVQIPRSTSRTHKKYTTA
ncbi:hypothetical protein PsYK624_000150 [Phanerochaete sordida]|uniref:Carbohydrate-binding module family 50 protein n=1 Tax=Phanerochaete sordida TaxID=48140 RepID=A0A9P3FWR8_9APHY|nr:hypothetical protein PsYK624_000150 [Phanerochaete sordida]